MQVLSTGNIVEFQVGVENGIEYPYTFQGKIVSYDLENNTAVVETNNGVETLDMQETNYCYTLIKGVDNTAEVESLIESLTPEQLEILKDKL